MNNDKMKSTDSLLQGLTNVISSNSLLPELVKLMRMNEINRAELNIVLMDKERVHNDNKKLRERLSTLYYFFVILFVGGLGGVYWAAEMKQVILWVRTEWVCYAEM